MRLGQAGHHGKDVRSDAHVSVEPRATGGIDLVLRSKVAPYYGDAIRSQVLRRLEQLGVAHARVEVEDTGALPFVLDARLETACRRAGIELPPSRPAPPVAPSPRARLRRSRLYLPGDEPKFLVNAALHAPDGVILDLEDSVHPAAKDAARQLVAHALREVDFGGCERMVRINPPPAGLEDLDAVLPARPDLVLLPKVQSADEVRQVAAHLGDAPVWLMPIVETALGVENAFAIASADPRVVALTIGLEDLTADLGVVKTAEGTESLWARSRIVVAARAAGLQPIDSVYGDVGDVEGLRVWAGRSRAMGFEGMGCVHPRQIEIIHEAFAPSADELERARRIVDAFEEAQSRGIGVVSLGSKMIDAPVVERARRLVARAAADAAAKGARG